MSEDSHPIMALLLEQSTFVGQAERVENEIEPLPEQFNFTIGDAAIIAAADTPLERDFVVGRSVNPERYAKDYPDWEERVQISAHVLLEVFSREDPELRLGWYSRLKLLPITNYRYRQARGWLKDGFPPEYPDWAVTAYQTYTDQLSKRAPDVIPHAVNCPSCSSREVSLIISRRIEYTGKAGVLTREGQDIYIPVNDPDMTSTHAARLQCTECGSTADLEDEEWTLPGISS